MTFSSLVAAMSVCASLVFGISTSVIAQEYDPLTVPATATSAPVNFTVTDAKRKRDIPVRVYLPPDAKAAPVILFSHGLGGSRTNNPYLGKHWAARGYVVVFMQHTGSDETVWRNKPLRDIKPALEKAAGGENFRLRVADVSAVLDALTVWNADAKHALSGRLDLSHVGMCGHSFGAVTTQAVSGQTWDAGSLREKRIDAALAMSPSAARQGGDNKKAFGSVTIPWLLMTGTKDDAPIGNTDARSRLAVFPALPPGDKYELVLKDAEHSAFGERVGRRPGPEPDPRYHRAILAIGTAFWDATLSGNIGAKAWLVGAGAKGVLATGDRWQTK